MSPGTGAGAGGDQAGEPPADQSAAELARGIARPAIYGPRRVLDIEVGPSRTWRSPSPDRELAR
jgi:hypothetical protein